MDIHFSSVVTAKVYNKTPTRLAVSFDLNKPPTFLIQQPRSYNQLPPTVHRFPPLGVTAGEWASCRDWTEDNQATKVLRHEITGPTDVLLQAAYHLNSVITLVFAASITPPQPREPRNDQQPQRPGISVATNAHGNSVSSPRALSQSPPPTYREVQQPYTNISDFPQQGDLAMFQPGNGLHSPTLPMEVYQTSTTMYPPPYSLMHAQQFVPLTEPTSFPAVMSDSALVNTYRPYQPPPPGSFTNSFSTSPSTATLGRGDVNHAQIPGEGLTNCLAGEPTMLQYRTSSTGHSAHASIESIPTVSDSTLISDFPSVGTANPAISTPMDSLVARASIPQHEFHSHLQESPFQTSNVLTGAFGETPSSTTPDWPQHPYHFMAYSTMPYTHPSHIQQDFGPYPAGH